MKFLLFLIPLITIILAVLIYRFNGKKEILKLDLVQFIYAFVVAPILFVWFKSFLFYFVRNEVSYELTLNQLFIVDSIFSTLFLFVYAFVVTHSVTKSLENKRFIDPFVDIFKLTESIHLRYSHFGIYFGAMIIFTFFSVFNIFFPLLINQSKSIFYLIISFGSIFGAVSFIIVWLSVYSERFDKLMKILYAVFFLIHAACFFIFDISFNVTYGIFWFVFFTFLMLAIFSLFFERSERMMKTVTKFHHKKGWKKGNFLLTK